MTAEGRRWLTVILLLGAVIRLTAAYVQPAYVDEAYNQYLCAAGPEAILDVMRFDTHTPCLQLLAYPLISVTDNIFILRLPSIILGLAAVLLNFYLLRCFFEERWALWLTAFTALSYHIFMNDSEFRPYSALTFFMTALWLAMLDIKNGRVPFAALGKENIHLRWLCFALIGLGCGCVHYLGTMEVFACGLWCLLFTSSAYKKRIAVFCTLCCIPSALWLIWTRLAPHPALAGGAELLSAEHLSHFLNYVAIAYYSTPLYLMGWNLSDFVNLGRGSLWSGMLAPYAPLISLLLNLLLWCCVVKGYKLLRAVRGEEAKLMALALFFPPALLLAAGLGNLISWGLTLYMVPMTVPYLVFLFSCIRSRAKYVLASAMIGSAAVICCAFPFWSEAWNCDWEGVVSVIEKNWEEDGIILLYPAYSAYSFARVYNPQGIDFVFERNKGLQCRQQRIPGKLAVVGLEKWMLDSRFCSRVLQGHRVFLVVSQYYNLTADDAEWRWLLQHYDASVLYRHNSLMGWAFADVLLLKPAAGIGETGRQKE